MQFRLFVPRKGYPANLLFNTYLKRVKNHLTYYTASRFPHFFFSVCFFKAWAVLELPMQKAPNRNLLWLGDFVICSCLLQIMKQVDLLKA